jgi:tRNA (guanine37-N1)-methyltransferase
MRFDVLSIFPESLAGFVQAGVLGQAQAAGHLEVRLHDLRDYTDDPHRTVDDRPYGGGAGMVMRAEPFVRAIESLRDQVEGTRRVVLLSSQGRLFTQGDAERYSGYDLVLLLCGRYEGVDERVLSFVDEEVSIGDYVLTGGEVAAAAVIEATARMLPGVVGKYESVETDSFYRKDRLGPPQYTRPPVFRGLPVPEVLLSGDHGKVEAFREGAAWEKTARNRPDLLGLLLDRKNRHG